jgi:hypothetical protein
VGKERPGSMPGLSFFSQQLDGLATLAPAPSPSLQGRGVSWLNVATGPDQSSRSIHCLMPLLGIAPTWVAAG